MNSVTPDSIMRQSRGEPASQAAGVEQTRAIAEVQAAVIMAKQAPRDEVRALAKALESCSMMEVAEVAFYKFPRAGGSVTGESIHLATELARCWGNISYGIMELARDDEKRVSEMLAFAWDLETNSQSRQTFLVPHKRDKRGGPEVLIEMRDIYENNANNGARRLRECIFRVLPPFLKEQAKARCYETMEKGRSDVPLPTLVLKACEAFEKRGISKDRLEAKLGPSTNWTRTDIAALEVSIRSIGRGEVSADEEFPRVAVDEVTQAARQIAERTAAERSKPQTVTVPAIVTRAEAATSIDDLERIEADWQLITDNASDEEAASVETALNAASRRIHNASKEQDNG
jgi:hypothetical protein